MGAFWRPGLPRGVWRKKHGAWRHTHVRTGEDLGGAGGHSLHSIYFQHQHILIPDPPNVHSTSQSCRRSRFGSCFGGGRDGEPSGIEMAHGVVAGQRCLVFEGDCHELAIFWPGNPKGVQWQAARLRSSVPLRNTKSCTQRCQPGHLGMFKTLYVNLILGSPAAVYGAD